MAEPVRLGLTGDVMLGRTVDRRQRERPPDAVWGDLKDRLRRLDGLVVNLECCLSTRGTPWTRTHRPFLFRADPDWAVPALDAAGVDACTLANNHVLDFGEPALLDTLDELAAADIATVGAGRDLGEAGEPATIDVGPLRVAIVGFTDNTPEYAAGTESPGTAHIEIDRADRETRSTVDSALSQARAADPDVVIASLHWGPNMVTEPTAEFQAFARWLVDRGVDVVHGHSAHVFQGIEIVDGAPICYDCGDFVDDYAVDPDLRNDRGFLFELVVDRAGAIDSVHLVPIEIRDCAVHSTDRSVANWCRDRMIDRSARFETSFDRAGQGLLLPVRRD